MYNSFEVDFEKGLSWQKSTGGREEKVMNGMKNGSGNRPRSDEELQRLTIGELKPTMIASSWRNMSRDGRCSLNGKLGASVLYWATGSSDWSMSVPPPYPGFAQNRSWISSLPSGIRRMNLLMFRIWKGPVTNCGSGNRTGMNTGCSKVRIAIFICMCSAPAP